MPQFPIDLHKSTRNRKNNGYEPLLQNHFKEERMQQKHDQKKSLFGNSSLEEICDETGEPLSLVVVKDHLENSSNYLFNSANSLKEDGFLINPHTSEDLVAKEENLDAFEAHVAFYYPNDNNVKKKKIRGLYDDCNEATDDEEDKGQGVRKAEVIIFLNGICR